MRKIKTMADIRKARRRNNIILGVVMIFLLVASTAGFAFMSGDDEDSDVVSENGFDFFRSNGVWAIAFDDQVFGFQNLPSEVSDIDVNVSVQFGNYNGQPLYFVNPGEGSGEILNNVGRYVLRYQEACLGDLVSFGNESFVVPRGNCTGDLPVKSCEDFNLIVFESGNETRVYGEGKCVFIEGDSLRGSDAFLYRILGIN